MRAPFKLKGHALPGPFKQYIDPTPTVIGIDVPTVNPSHVQDLTESIKKYNASKVVKKTSKLAKIMKFLGGKGFGVLSLMFGAHSASAQSLTERQIHETENIDYSKIIGNLPVEEKSKRTKEQVVVESAD